MASAAATQVGTYFLRNYYNLLQQSPDVVHQFYNDASTMVRVDDLAGTNTTASTMMDIHSLIMSLNFTQIEIKTANFVNSWDDGVLVMVSGLVQTKEYNHQRKFIQMFFLAPQEKGYFVLNDYFHFVDQEQVQTAPAISQENFEGNMTSNMVVETVPEYIHEEENQSAIPITSEESDAVDNYTYSEPPQQVVSQSDNWADEPLPEEPLSSFPNGMAMAPEEPVQPPPVPPHVEEPVGEPVKKTYASILRTAKAPPVFPVAQLAPNKTSHPATETNQATQATSQHSVMPSSMAAEKPKTEVYSEVAVHDDEVESKSVYVGNVPSSLTEADLENEFRKFGRLIPDGVAIRSRKETGGYYAFVEFEELSGVHNALKASPIEINGRQIYVEERRPNSGIRGGRRGGRGRFSAGGRGYARGGGDTEYGGNRGRSNGYQRIPHHERGILGSHNARN
ncbi:hypothetical protein ABZP36_028864 [Zizania latifolia]